MNELCIPTRCQHDDCTSGADIGLVEVLDAEGKRKIGALSQFLRRRGKRQKVVKILKIGYQFVQWHYYCAEHFEAWRDAGKNQRESA